MLHFVLSIPLHISAHHSNNTCSYRLSIDREMYLLPYCACLTYAGGVLSEAICLFTLQLVDWLRCTHPETLEHLLRCNWSCFILFLTHLPNDAICTPHSSFEMCFIIVFFTTSSFLLLFFFTSAYSFNFPCHYDSFSHSTFSEYSRSNNMYLHVNYIIWT